MTNGATAESKCPNLGEHTWVHLAQLEMSARTSFMRMSASIHKLFALTSVP